VSEVTCPRCKAELADETLMEDLRRSSIRQGIPFALAAHTYLTDLHKLHGDLDA